MGGFKACGVWKNSGTSLVPRGRYMREIFQAAMTLGEGCEVQEISDSSVNVCWCCRLC